MVLTLSSFFIIPYGIYCFFQKSDLLIKAIIFSIPFSATSILNLSSGVPISAFQFLCLLFFFKQTLFILYRGTLFWPSDKTQAVALTLCFLFLTICCISLLTPALIDGHYYIHSIDSKKGYPLMPLIFSISSFKKLFPLFIGILLIFFLLQQKTTLIRLRSFLTTYIISIFIISLWGIFQYICWVVGIEYPSYIFNTMPEDLRVSDSEITGNNGIIRRIYSVTQEPSHFVCFLLSALPILYVTNFYGEPLFKKFWGTLMIVIIISTILISFSTTGIGGLVIFIFLTYLNLHSKNPFNFILKSILLFSVLSIFIFALSQLEFINNFLSIVFIEKLISGSMIERIFFIEKAYFHFLDYPILGLGMGNVTSSDLLIFLLSNIGILGLCSFLILVIYLIKITKNYINQIKESGSYEAKMLTLPIIHGILISFYLQLSIYILMGFVWYLPIFYIMIFFMISANSNNLKP